MKYLMYSALTSAALLAIALFFPTWTSTIKGGASISTLEQVEINGVEHEIMIRGANKDNPVMILVHADLDHLKRRTLFNMKIYWKQILLW